VAALILMSDLSLDNSTGAHDACRGKRLRNQIADATLVVAVVGTNAHSPKIIVTGLLD